MRISNGKRRVVKHWPKTARPLLAVCLRLVAHPRALALNKDTVGQVTFQDRPCLEVGQSSAFDELITDRLESAFAMFASNRQMNAVLGRHLAARTR